MSERATLVNQVSRFACEIDASGAFRRQGNRFTDRVTADGSSAFPVAPARYELIASPACPWSHCAIIVRRLLGLEDVIGLSVVELVTNGDMCWRFTTTGERISATEPASLADAYLDTDPQYRDRVTVPVLYDRETRCVVSNDFIQIPLDFCTEWSAFHAPGAPQLYPRALRARIDALDALAVSDICDGVYRCGLATSQAAYEEAYQRLFDRLDWFSMMLSNQRFLLGEQITEADVRLFATLVRFDVVYHGHFKCNRNKLTEMPVLSAYARDLFHTPGLGDAVDFEQIKSHYYRIYSDVSPGTIIPRGPDLSGWHTEHGRESLTGPCE